MPLDVSELLSKRSSVGSNGFVNSIFGGNFTSSFLIAIMIVFIILIYLPMRKDIGFSEYFKVGIYIFLTSAITIFLHDCTIIHALEKKEKEEEAKSLISGDSSEFVNTVKINPKIDGMSGDVKNQNADKVGGTVNDPEETSESESESESDDESEISKLQSVKESNTSPPSLNVKKNKFP